MMLFPDDPYLSESEVRDLLEPLHPYFLDCVLVSFETINDACHTHPLLGQAIDGSPRAHLMNALVVELVRQRLDAENRAVQILDNHGFLELRVQDAIDVRFKKVDESGRSCNYPTKTDWHYRNQLPLFGDHIIETARVTLGWRWDVTATEIADVTIVYAKGDDIMWQYSIIDEAADGVMPAAPMPSDDPIESQGASYESEHAGQEQEEETA